MDELSIDYNISKKRKVINIIMFSFFGAYGLFNCVKEGLVNNFSLEFYMGLSCFLLGATLVLSYTTWLPAPILSINNNHIAANLPTKKKFTVDWVNVSRVNIGPGYITFLLNGEQKQQRLELLSLKYEDLLAVKAKLMELCEFKNIPYHND